MLSFACSILIAASILLSAERLEDLSNLCRYIQSRYDKTKTEYFIVFLILCSLRQRSDLVTMPSAACARARCLGTGTSLNIAFCWCPSTNLGTLPRHWLQRKYLGTNLNRFHQCLLCLLSHKLLKLQLQIFHWFLDSYMNTYSSGHWRVWTTSILVLKHRTQALRTKSEQGLSHPWHVSLISSWVGKRTLSQTPGIKDRIEPIIMQTSFEKTFTIQSSSLQSFSFDSQEHLISSNRMQPKQEYHFMGGRNINSVSIFRTVNFEIMSERELHMHKATKAATIVNDWSTD